MKLEFTINSFSPTGTIIYSDSQSRISFEWEFGGGDCWYIIFVPSEDEWTSKTGIPIADRSKILRFIFEETIRKETKNGTIKQKAGYLGYYYKLTEKSISIHEKKIPELNKTRRFVIRILLRLRRFFMKKYRIRNN